MSGRQSGRTTRMCRLAHELAQRGKIVYILVQDRKDQQRVIGHLNRGDGIRVELFDEETFCWTRMSFTVEKMPRGIPFEKVVVFVDHQVIQNKFPAMINMYDSYAERRGHPRNDVENMERFAIETANDMRSELAVPRRRHDDPPAVTKGGVDIINAAPLIYELGMS